MLAQLSPETIEAATRLLTVTHAVIRYGRRSPGDVGDAVLVPVEADGSVPLRDGTYEVLLFDEHGRMIWVWRPTDLQCVNPPDHLLLTFEGFGPKGRE